MASVRSNKAVPDLPLDGIMIGGYFKFDLTTGLPKLIFHLLDIFFFCKYNSPTSGISLEPKEQSSGSEGVDIRLVVVVVAGTELFVEQKRYYNRININLTKVK